MTDMFEYNEVRWPSRTQDQEEEEQALKIAHDVLAPPVISWNEASGSGNKKTCLLLVICASVASTALLQQACPDRKLVATVKPVEVPLDAAEDSLGLAFSRSDHICSIHAHDYDCTVLSIDCPPQYSADRATAWTRAVLGVLQPQHVVILGSLQAELYRGEGDASQESLVYLLETESARQLRGPDWTTARYLPTGTVVPGLLAAAISWCQLRGIPAQLLVTVDMVAGLLPHSIPPLAAAAAKLLQQTGATTLASEVAQESAIAAAQQTVAGDTELSAMYT